MEKRKNKNGNHPSQRAAFQKLHLSRFQANSTEAGFGSAKSVKNVALTNNTHLSQLQHKAVVSSLSARGGSPPLLPSNHTSLILQLSSFPPLGTTATLSTVQEDSTVQDDKAAQPDLDEPLPRPTDQQLTANVAVLQNSIPSPHAEPAGGRARTACDWGDGARDGGRQAAPPVGQEGSRGGRGQTQGRPNHWRMPRGNDPSRDQVDPDAHCMCYSVGKGQSTLFLSRLLPGARVTDSTFQVQADPDSALFRAALGSVCLGPVGDLPASEIHPSNAIRHITSKLMLKNAEEAWSKQHSGSPFQAPLQGKLLETSSGHLFGATILTASETVIVDINLTYFPGAFMHKMHDNSVMQHDCTYSAQLTPSIPLLPEDAIKYRSKEDITIFNHCRRLFTDAKPFNTIRVQSVLQAMPPLDDGLRFFLDLENPTPDGPLDVRAISSTNPALGAMNDPKLLLKLMQEHLRGLTKILEAPTTPHDTAASITQLLRQVTAGAQAEILILDHPAQTPVWGQIFTRAMENLSNRKGPGVGAVPLEIKHPYIIDLPRHVPQDALEVYADNSHILPYSMSAYQPTAARALKHLTSVTLLTGDDLYMKRGGRQTAFLLQFAASLPEGQVKMLPAITAGEPIPRTPPLDSDVIYIQIPIEATLSLPHLQDLVAGSYFMTPEKIRKTTTRQAHMVKLSRVSEGDGTDRAAMAIKEYAVQSNALGVNVSDLATPERTVTIIVNPKAWGRQIASSQLLTHLKHMGAEITGHVWIQEGMLVLTLAEVDMPLLIQGANTLNSQWARTTKTTVLSTLPSTHPPVLTIIHKGVSHPTSANSQPSALRASSTRTMPTPKFYSTPRATTNYTIVTGVLPDTYNAAALNGALAQCGLSMAEIQSSQWHEDAEGQRALIIPRSDPEPMAQVTESITVGPHTVVLQTALAFKGRALTPPQQGDGVLIGKFHDALRGRKAVLTSKGSQRKPSTPAKPAQTRARTSPQSTPTAPTSSKRIATARPTSARLLYATRQRPTEQNRETIPLANSFSAIAATEAEADDIMQAEEDDTQCAETSPTEGTTNNHTDALKPTLPPPAPSHHPNNRTPTKKKKQKKNKKTKTPAHTIFMEDQDVQQGGSQGSAADAATRAKDLVEITFELAQALHEIEATEAWVANARDETDKTKAEAALARQKETYDHLLAMQYTLRQETEEEAGQEEDTGGGSVAEHQAMAAREGESLAGGPPGGVRKTGANGSTNESQPNVTSAEGPHAGGPQPETGVMNSPTKNPPISNDSGGKSAVRKTKAGGSVHQAGGSPVKAAEDGSLALGSKRKIDAEEQQGSQGTPSPTKKNTSTTTETPKTLLNDGLTAATVIEAY